MTLRTNLLRQREAVPQIANSFRGRLAETYGRKHQNACKTRNVSLRRLPLFDLKMKHRSAFDVPQHSWTAPNILCATGSESTLTAPETRLAASGPIRRHERQHKLETIEGIEVWGIDV